VWGNGADPLVWGRESQVGFDSRSPQRAERYDHAGRDEIRDDQADPATAAPKRVSAAHCSQKRADFGVDAVSRFDIDHVADCRDEHER
jgi:hypothetical protein